MTARVLYVAPDPALRAEQLGGAGTHIRGTLAALRSQGFEVEVLVGAPAAREGRPTVAQRPMPLLRRVLPRPVRLLARDARLLAHGRALRASEVGAFDCVYERSAYLLDVGRPLAHRRGVPYLVETDGILVDATAAAYGAVLRRAAESLERRKVGEADAVVVMSEASRDAVAVRYGVPHERLLVKGLGVEQELLDRPPRAEPTVDVGFAGTFQPYHGVELLVEALRLLEGRSALLAGDGPLRARVERAAAGLPVELPGLLSREAALARLAACRVLVVPESAATLYPVKLLEYAALRRPIVCPRRPAFDEFNRGTRLLFQFDPGDAADLARAIDEALAGKDGDRVERLCALVASEYTWDAVGIRLADRIRALFKSR